MSYLHLHRETITFITKLFKHTNFRIVYKIKNSLGHNLRFEKQTDSNKDKYVSRGVYKLICPHCDKVCIDETSISLTQEFKARHLSFINNHTTSKFARHLLEYANTATP